MGKIPRMGFGVAVDETGKVLDNVDYGSLGFPNALAVNAEGRLPVITSALYERDD